MKKKYYIIISIFISLSFLFCNQSYASTVGDTISLNFEVSDSIMHPTKPIIYITSKDTNELYSVNYETEEITSITFNLPPESLTFANNEIYVSLLKGEHSSYWRDEYQQGAVAIVDTTSFTRVAQFDIDIDPFDIIADRDGYIHIISGSGQWTYMKSYLRSTMLEVSTTGIRQQSYGEIHPTLNKIYTIDTDSSPRDMDVFEITNGKISTSYDSPYHGDYAMAKNFRLSPDGKYIFNGAGTIFTTNASKTEDMKYVTKLNKGFTDIAFDLDSNRFYTGTYNKNISVYEIIANTDDTSDEFHQIGTYFTKGEVKRVFFNNNQLVAITNELGQYYIEKVNMGSMLSCKKDITSFIVSGVEGKIEGNKIYVRLPVSVNLINIVASFEYSPLATVCVSGVTQVSGQTSNDFTQSIIYTVTAEDGSTKEYTVIVENYMEKGTIQYGDVSFDGQITLDDSSLITGYLEGSNSLTDFQLIAADLNGDGKVNEIDSGIIKEFLMGKITQFPIKSMSYIPLYTMTTDSVMDSTNSCIYITDKESKKLYSINLETKEISFITFDLPPESLTFANNEIYVSLLKGNHSSYWWDEDQQGAVAIVDATSFTKVAQFDIDIDPFDIIADRDGYIYIISGSGQWTYMKSYSRSTMLEVSTTRIRQRSYGEMHPTLNRIYTISTDSSPRDMDVFEITNGEISTSYDSPYHGDYTMAKNFRLSPDGKYIFNGAGTIFTTNVSKTEDMKYVTKLNNGFTDIAFDLDNNRFYTGSDNKISSYNYDEMKSDGLHYYTKGQVKNLYFLDNKFYVLSTMNDNNDIIQIINKDSLKSIGALPEDINGDGLIDLIDLSFLTQLYNINSEDYRFDPNCDLNYDGVIDLYDIVILSRNIN